MLLLEWFLLLLLVQFSHSLQGNLKKCNPEQLEAWKQIDLTDKDFKDGYHLKINEKIIPRELSDHFITESDDVVEYQLQLYSANGAKPITDFVVLADAGGCQQPAGWFDKLDPQWDVVQCTVEKCAFLKVTVYSDQQNIVKFTWTTFLHCNTTFRFTVASGLESLHRAHPRLIRSATFQSDQAPYLLLANYHFIHQLRNLDVLSTRRTIVSVPNGGIVSLDYHARLGKLFWSDRNTHKIMQSNLDGSQPNPIVSCSGCFIGRLAVDWISDKLYYTKNNDHLVVLDLATNQQKTLIRDSNLNIYYRNDIVVDPTTRYLYWNTYSRLMKVSMDGNNRTVVNIDNNGELLSFTMDYQNQVLYFVYHHNILRVNSSNVDGTNTTLIAQFLHYTSYSRHDRTTKICLFGNILIISLTFYRSNNITIYEVHTNSENVVLVGRTLERILPRYWYHLIMKAKLKQPLVPNPCGTNNGGCSHFCLLSAVDPLGYTCDCPEGMILSSDMNNCTKVTTSTALPPSTITPSIGSCLAGGYSSCCVNGSCLGSPSVANCYCDANCHLFKDCCNDVPNNCDEQGYTEYILITNRYHIHQIDINNTRSRLQTPWSALDYVISLDYHYRKRHLFWTAKHNGSVFIWQSNLNDGSGAVRLVDTEAISPTQYVDWIADKIYWTNINAIMVYDLQRGYKATVIDSTEPGALFHQVIVDPNTRTIYWSDIGSNPPKIKKASMDGSDIRTVVSLYRANVNYTFVFTLDYSKQMLYWINGSNSYYYTNYIESSSVEGSERKIVYNTSRIGSYSYRSPYYRSQAIDFFGGAVYSYSASYYYYDIYKTEVESRPTIVRYESGSGYMHYSAYTGMKVISRQRQLQGVNPCAINNGGCAHLCLLSSSDSRNYTCACHIGTQLQNRYNCIGALIRDTPVPQGSCSAAGYSSCCVSGSCKGEPPNCYCDSLCYIFKDCCPDANALCQINNATSGPTIFNFITRPQNITTNQSSRVEFQCSVCSLTLIPNFMWNFTRKGISEPKTVANRGQRFSPDYSIRTGHRTQVLIITNVHWKHEGVYKCIVSVKNSQIQADSNLNVPMIEAQASLDVLIPLSNLSIRGDSKTPRELDTVTIECNVTANPPATITWLKRTSERVRTLTSNSKTSITHHLNYTPSGPASGSALIISNVEENDNGDYICEARNNRSSSELINFNFTVITRNDCIIDNLGSSPCQNRGVCVDHIYSYTCHCSGSYTGVNCSEEVPSDKVEPPVINQPPESTITLLGDPIHLNCTAEGHPAPIYEWYKDGVLLPDERESVLYIPEPSPEDRGNYTCKAINSEGETDESRPAKLDIADVVQYQAKLNISEIGVGMELEQIMESITTSVFPNSSASVFEVKLLSVNMSSDEATLLITVRRHDISFELSAIQSQLRSAMLLILQTHVVTISRFDGCNYTVSTNLTDPLITIEWPETSLGDTASVPCPCAEFAGSLAGRAYRYCNGTFSQGAHWEEYDTSECETLNRDTTRKLCLAALILAMDPGEASRVAVEETSTPEKLTAAQVSVSISIVANITNEVLNNSKVRENYLQAIDNIQQANPDVILESQKETSSSSRLLDSLESFLDKVEVEQHENSTSNSSQAVFAFETFALQIQQLDPEEYRGQIFSVNLGSVEKAIKDNQTIDQGALVTSELESAENLDHKMKKQDITDLEGVMNAMAGTTASLQLPEDLLDLCSDVNSNSTSAIPQRLSYSVFKSDVLFQNLNQSHFSIGSIIVAARLKCADNVTLNTSIKSTFQINRMVEEKSIGSACAMWDKGDSEERFGAWSTEGCWEVVRDGNRRVCECSQLAHFGILFDLSPKEPISVEAAIALSVITYAGLIVSLLCLTVFVISYFSVKKLRTTIHGQILINLSLALMGVYIFFLIGGHVTSIPVLCGISSALLQYFLLVFFGWTAVEAVWLYLKLVKVFGIQSATSKFIVKAGTPTWVVPLVVVTLCAGAGSKHYVNPFYCRATEWPFWIGMISPVLLVTIFNWIMFVLIMVSICSHTPGPVTDKKEGSKMKAMKTNFTVAVTLAVMFGLGWALGLTATSLPVKELTLTFQILFSIFVGAQGVLLFLLHGVRNQDIRKVWIQCFTTIGRKSRLTSMISSTKTSSAGPQSMWGTKNTSGISTLPRKRDESASALQNIYSKQNSVGGSVAMEIVPPASKGQWGQSESGLEQVSYADNEEHIYDEAC